MPHLVVFTCNGDDREDELLDRLYRLQGVGALDLVGPIVASEEPYDEWALKVPPDQSADRVRSRWFWRFCAALIPMVYFIWRFFATAETNPTLAPGATLFFLVRNIELARVCDGLQGCGAGLLMTTLGREASKALREALTRAAPGRSEPSWGIGEGG